MHSLKWQKLWKMTNISPRVQTFILRLWNSALPLLSSINKRLPVTNTSCPFCLLHDEDSNHLFLNYKTASAIWFACPVGLWVDNNLNIYSLIQHWLHDPQAHETFRLGASISWAIWKARGDCIFRQQAPCIHSIIRNGVSTFNAYTTRYNASLKETRMSLCSNFCHCWATTGIWRNQD